MHERMAATLDRVVADIRQIKDRGAHRRPRRPDGTAASRRASRRLTDRDFDALFHDRQARHLRLQRLSVADPSPHAPSHEPRQLPRAWPQGRGDDEYALRPGRAQRPRPLSPDHGRGHARRRSRTQRQRARSGWSTRRS